MLDSSSLHFPETRALRRNWRSANRAVSFRATSVCGSPLSVPHPQVRLTSKLMVVNKSVKCSKQSIRNTHKDQFPGKHYFYTSKIITVLCRLHWHLDNTALKLQTGWLWTYINIGYCSLVGLYIVLYVLWDVFEHFHVKGKCFFFIWHVIRSSDTPCLQKLRLFDKWWTPSGLHS